MFTGRTDAKAETPQYFDHLMGRVDSLERTLMLGGIGAGGEGDDRGWDGWMASPTRWTWVWVDSRTWWWTGRPGVLWFMGSQRVGHNWVTEVNWRYDNSIFVMWAPPHNIFRRCKLHYLGVKCHAVSMHTNTHALGNRCIEHGKIHITESMWWIYSRSMYSSFNVFTVWRC